MPRNRLQAPSLPCDPAANTLLVRKHHTVVCVRSLLHSQEERTYPILIISDCNAFLPLLFFAFGGALFLQTRAVGVICRVGCAESVDAELQLRVAGALIIVVARPWGVLEVGRGLGGGGGGGTHVVHALAVRHEALFSRVGGRGGGRVHMVTPANACHVH